MDRMAQKFPLRALIALRMSFRKIHCAGSQPVFGAVYPADALIAPRGYCNYGVGAFRHHSLLVRGKLPTSFSCWSYLNLSRSFQTRGFQMIW